MRTATPVSSLQKFIKYATPRGYVYLHNGVVTRNGQPLVGVTRWDANRTFNEAVRQYGGQDGLVQPETLYASWSAAEQDPEAKKILFTWPAKWQSHIIVPSDTPTETPQHVLRYEDGRPLLPSKTPRVLNPTQMFKEGNNDRGIVIGTVFDLPFELKSGFYNGLEDLDPETGFLKQVRSEGKYGVRFNSDPRLCAAILSWGGSVGCRWEPSRSSADVGLRGRSTGNQGQLPEGLVESEEERTISQRSVVETYFGVKYSSVVEAVRKGERNKALRLLEEMRSDIESLPE